MPLDVLWTWSVWQRTLCVSKTVLYAQRITLHYISIYFVPSCKCCFCLISSNRCDKGYGGAHCVPLAPLPSVLREDFNENLQQETWPEVYGAERGTLSGEPLKSGTALIFKGVGLPHMMERKSGTIIMSLNHVDTNFYINMHQYNLFAGWSANDRVKGPGLYKHSLYPVLLQIHHQRY